MAPRPRGSSAAVGFTVKSGWACAVLLTGEPSSPRVADSCRVELSDPAVPEARQPYHSGFTTARRPGAELSRLLTSVEQFGRQAVTTAIGQYRLAGHDLRGVGVVVGSMIDPDTIANEHIRIHALEGRLFRRVIDDAVTRSGLQCSMWRERDLRALAPGALGLPEDALRLALTTLGKEYAGPPTLLGAVPSTSLGAGPWRTEQKAAALAAWIVLAGGAVVGDRRASSSRRNAAV